MTTQPPVAIGAVEVLIVTRCRPEPVPNEAIQVRPRKSVGLDLDTMSPLAAVPFETVAPAVVAPQLAQSIVAPELLTSSTVTPLAQSACKTPRPGKVSSGVVPCPAERCTEAEDSVPFPSTTCPSWIWAAVIESGAIAGEVTEFAARLGAVTAPVPSLSLETEPFARLWFSTAPPAILLDVTTPFARLPPSTESAASLLDVTTPFARLAPSTESAPSLLDVTAPFARLAPSTEPTARSLLMIAPAWIFELDTEL